MKNCSFVEYDDLPSGATCIGTEYRHGPILDKALLKRVEECQTEVFAVVTEHIDRYETHQGWTTDYYAAP